MGEQVTADVGVAVLEPLVGTWRISGGAEGVVTYRWLDGGHFLVQDVRLEQYGEQITGMEVIGRERRFGEAQGTDLNSRFYSNAGDTLDYVYEIDGDELTIWAGEKGSPAYMRGRFDSGGEHFTGAWTYPGGGGYATSMVRVAPGAES